MNDYVRRHRRTKAELAAGARAVPLRHVHGQAQARHVRPVLSGFIAPSGASTGAPRGAPGVSRAGAQVDGVEGQQGRQRDLLRASSPLG
jgi:hypothetical protein